MFSDRTEVTLLDECPIVRCTNETCTLCKVSMLFYRYCLSMTAIDSRDSGVFRSNHMEQIVRAKHFVIVLLFADKCDHTILVHSGRRATHMLYHSHFLLIIDPLAYKRLSKHEFIMLFFNDLRCPGVDDDPLKVF